MDAVDEVKRRLDIVDVVGETVALQRAGRNFKAVCPFHSEKTPSFFVFPDRQSWHCFGACSTGGDVFAFVMKRNNVDFPEALKLLAERAGIALRRPQSSGQKVRERLRQANEAAIVFFQNALMNNESGRAAFEYMTLRGIDGETAQAFRLGYAYDSWDALREHLKARGFSESELLRAGLLVEGESGAYDRFRQRLMIPIRDEDGRAVGFGSRVLEEAKTAGEDDSPKYLNTPQTPIFDKGAVLYGLDRAKEHISRSDLAVIVEGYMDVIAAHQHEDRNVVASMGTALTERQVGLLHRYTENFVLAFDPDEAGRMASERGYDLAFELGAKIRVMKLPAGRDPDEIIRAEPEEWRRLVLAAEPLPLDRPPRAVAIGGSRTATRTRASRPADVESIDPGKGEETCLALLLRFPDLRECGLEVDDDLFVVSQNRQVFQSWRANPDPAALEEGLAEELLPHLERIVGKELPPYDPVAAKRALTDCIGRIRRRKIIEAKTITAQTIAEKEQELGAARLAESAHKLLQDGAPSDDLPEEDAGHAAIVVRDMETGKDLHVTRQREAQED